MNSIYTDRDNLLWRDDDSLIGTIFQYEIDSMYYEILVEGTNAPSNPGVTVYQNNRDVTATVIPVGVLPVQGQLIRLAALHSLETNLEYTVVIRATIAGKTEIRKLIIDCIDRHSSLSQEVGCVDRRNLIWRLEQPEIGVVFQYPSETITYTITVEGSSPPEPPSVNLTVLVFADGGNANQADSVMPGGSHNISGQVLTLKPLTNLKAGSSYSVMIRCIILNDFRQSKLIVKCVDPKAA